jgi:DNA-binding IclR family transcriptional regulator
MTAPKKNRSAQRSTPPRRTTKGAASTPEPHSPWTFLSNHAHVLIVLHSEPDLVLREVALRVGITERGVQRIVQELEEGGYLTRERVGRRNHYVISSGMHLRHPVEAHCTIDQVLTLVSQARTSDRKRRARTT